PTGKPTSSLTFPPADNRRPSGRTAWPAQNKSESTGIVVKLLVTGSQICGSGLPTDMRSHARIRPSFKRLRWTDTNGQLNRPDHSPVWAGLPGVVFENDTCTCGVVASARAASHA